MKHIKSFESLNTPQIGDYVLYKKNNSEIIDIYDFLNNNIGQYIGDKNHLMVIKYDNIPFEIEQNYFNKTKNTINLNPRDIIEFSPNKKDLELILKAKKYNL